MKVGGRFFKEEIGSGNYEKRGYERERLSNCIQYRIMMVERVDAV